MSVRQQWFDWDDHEEMDDTGNRSVSRCLLTQGDPGAVYKTLSLFARQKLKPGLFEALCGDPENDL